jgi:hypothetical protein
MFHQTFIIYRVMDIINPNKCFLWVILVIYKIKVTERDYKLSL